MNRIVLYPALSLFIILAALISPDFAAAQGFKPFNTAREANKQYTGGLRSCDPDSITRARDLYYEVLDSLENDPDGLGERYQFLVPKLKYNVGFCWFRLYEIEYDDVCLDSAYTWFGSVSLAAPDSLGYYASYMAGECRLGKAHMKKFSDLCDGELDGIRVDEIMALLDDATASFDVFDTKFQTALDVTAALRKFDAEYEKTRLLLAVDDIDADSAIVLLNKPAHGTLVPHANSTGAQSLAPILDYTEAIRLWYQYLLEPGDSLDQLLSPLLPQFGSEERLRVGGKYLADNEYDDAADFFENASTQDNIWEAHYWLGFVNLIRSISSPQLLDDSRDAFIRFDSIADSRNVSNPRLLWLKSWAKRRSDLLRIALGQRVSPEFLNSLGREEVKFLIRVAAAVHGRSSRQCLRTVESFLNTYNQASAGQPVAPTGTDCSIGEPTPLAADEVIFFKGIVTSLLAGHKSQPPQRRAGFAQAAGILDGVRGDYEQEARYVRARSLFLAGQHDESRDLLRQLIREQHSLRSLYILGVNYGDIANLSDDQRDTVCKIMSVVSSRIAEAGIPEDYEIFKANADSYLNSCGNYHLKNVSLNISGWDRVECPESLSVDRSGPVPALVFYETLAKQEWVRKQFTDECINELLVFGLPKRNLYPVSKACATGRDFANTIAPIPNPAYFDEKWKPFVRLTSESKKDIRSIESCLLHDITTNERLPCLRDDSSGNLTSADRIPIDHCLLMTIFCDSYHPRTIELCADEPGYVTFVAPLTEKVRYGLSGRVSSAPDSWLMAASESGNVVLCRHALEETVLPSDLRDAYYPDSYIRDICYDFAEGRCYLAVDRRYGTSLLEYPSEKEYPLNLAGSDARSLKEPEGIAIDSERHLYIADYGHHRIVVFDADGRYIREFDGSAAGAIHFIKSPYRLAYPCRITIEEDKTGLRIDNSDLVFFRETYLLVTDSHGVHRFDSRGQYLETVISADTGDLNTGDFTDLAISGYGMSSILYLVDRGNQTLIQYLPNQAE